MFEKALIEIETRKETLEKFMQEIFIKLEATLAPFMSISKDFETALQKADQVQEDKPIP